MADRNYNLKLDSRQAKIVVQSLDLFSRIGMGQFDEIMNVLRYNMSENVKNMELSEDLLKQVKKLVFDLDGNSHFGITGNKTGDTYKIAYDIQCVLRREIADKEQHSAISCWHDHPLHVMRDIPLAECTSEIP